jgi:OOP family OmpA-OmpF porin
VSTRSFGETQPVADNELNGQDNPAGRALNRRVLIIELP